MAEVETEYGAAPPSPHELDGKSLTELLRDLTNDSATLVRQESELLRKEMDARVSRLQREVAILGTGGVIALIGVLALTAALILLLDLAMWGWLAALIVGALYVIAGGILLLVGRNKLRDEEMKPTETIRSVKHDIKAMREAWR